MCVRVLRAFLPFTMETSDIFSWGKGPNFSSEIPLVMAVNLPLLMANFSVGLLLLGLPNYF